MELAGTPVLIRLRRVSGQLVRLRPREWWILIQMLCMVVAISILQDRFSLPRLIKFFDARPQTRKPPVSIGRLAKLADALMRRLYRRDYCMKRSLILFHFLRKWGEPVYIHFGVKKRDLALDGHAWVELNGAPLCEPANPKRRFTTTYVYPLG